MNVQDTKDLFTFDAWATNRTLDAVAALTEEQFKKDLGNSFGSVHGTLIHVFGADKIWLARWKNGVPTATKSEDIPTLDQLRKSWADIFDETQSYIALVTDEQLQNPHTYKDLRGNVHTQPLYQQLQHKVNHSTYHRGQITTMLRQLGAKPVGTDLITFYRERK
jgi:uncharacterized damage-inducible protein DinB